MDAEAGFASVFDVIYADTRLVAAQLAFLEAAFASRPGPLLDAGCGTGRHLLPLRTRGYAVTGVDLSAAMLRNARDRLAVAKMAAPLVRGDLRALPFGPTFAGILCLDSPLALIPEEDGLAAALAGLHRTLLPGGVLVAEVYDYVGTLGEAPIPPWTGRFPAPWGHVIIHETHHCDRTAHIWEMTQGFEVHRSDQRQAFTIRHRLRIRPADAYAAAIEKAGFRIEELLSSYPRAPGYASFDLRMIFRARKA